MNSVLSPSNIFSFLLGFVLFCSTAWSQDITLTLDTVNAGTNPTASVPLSLTSGAGTAAAITAEIHFDGKRLSVNDVSTGAASASAGKTVYWNQKSPHVLQIAITGMNINTIGAGELGTIEFKVKGQPTTRSAPLTGTIDLTGENLTAASPVAAPLTVGFVDGGVSGTFPGLSGLSFLFILLLAGILVALSFRYLSRKQVLWALALISTLSWTAMAARPAGDFDNSGTINLADLNLLVAAFFGVPHTYIADLDQNGAIQARDFVLLFRVFNGDEPDTDGDGILDIGEDERGTDKNVTDTDGDGIDDGDEVEGGTDPLADQSSIVVINEFMANNDTGIVDEDGDAVDWLELYNTTDNTIDLAGWSLTDDVLIPRKFTFPAGTTIAAGEYKLLFASGKIPAPSNLHIDFRLERNGEYLALFDATNAVTPIYEFTPLFPRQKKDTSYGRLGNTAFLRYFDVPTPGAFNAVLGGAFTGFVDDLVFNAPRGFYIAGFDLSVSSPTPGTTVYYTTDGTEPSSSNGTQLVGNYTITGNTAFRAIGTHPDFLDSPIETNTYLINVPAEQQALPTFVMTADPQESLYEPNGIMAIVGGQYVVGTFGILVWEPVDLVNDYNNPSQHGIAYERPLSLEYILPADNSGFQADAGVRISGSDFHRPRYRRDAVPDWTGPGPFARMASYNKFSFRYYFRDRYGPKDLEYPLFTSLGSTVTSFDRLVARGGHNDGYNPFIRDELTRRLHTDLGELAANGMLANIFINGEYKAYYNITERIDEDFLQSHLLTNSEFDIAGFINTPGAWEIKEGDAVAFQALMDLVDSGANFALPGIYQQIVDMVDIDAFINYLLIQLYTGNDDWPINNWLAGREKVAGAKWTFYVWDSEGTFGGSIVGSELAQVPETGLDSYPFWRPSGGAGIKGENTPVANIYRAAVQNASFRARFNTLTHAAFDTGGALADANVTARYTALKTKFLGVSQILTDYGHTFDTFIEDSWIAARRAVILAALQGEGLYVP
jgi:hypothetical protein